MTPPTIETLGIIAGKGAYPLLLAESARKQGVKKIYAVAFKGETSGAIRGLADQTVWLRVGLLDAFLDAIRASGATSFVMAGQITPGNLFHARLDRRMIALLRSLKAWNAHTIFGALCDELRAIGVTLLPAWQFMESAMPEAGPLAARPFTERELNDAELGLRVARMTGEFEIGQTVVVKDGVILAVEAFEGTDQAILRAGKIGGPGGVVIKTAKPGHDMRFDIPVVGMKTMKALKKARISALAVGARQTIFLERERVAAEADRHGIAIQAFETKAMENPT